MHVLCKHCGSQIAVAGRPTGSNTLSNVQLHGNVRVGDGGIVFGEGGGISFGPDGGITFCTPLKSSFSCMNCGKSAEYDANEIKDD